MSDEFFVAGEFAMVPLDKIKLNPKLRYRADYPKVEALMKSLARPNKQLLPIIIDTAGFLVIGRRRFEAAKRLGWPSILCRIVDLPEPSAAQLDENEEREPPTFRERLELATAVEDIEKVKANERVKAGRPSSNLDEGRTDEKAAEAVGWGKGTFRAAKIAGEHGTKKLIDALDAEIISVSDAAKVASLPAKVQDQAVKEVVAGKAPTVAAAAGLPSRGSPVERNFRKRPGQSHAEAVKWYPITRDLNHLTRGINAIAKKHSAEAQSTDYQDFIRGLQELKAVLKSWQERLTKIEGP